MSILPLENESYDQYISRIFKSRPNKKVEKGQQRHHILPKSRGGLDEDDNLIWLYKTEHAKAHYLYSKEHPNDSGMAYAAHAMSYRNGVKLSDEEIEEIAKLNSELQSKRVSGENNPMYGKHHTEESRKKNSESNKGKSAGEKNPMYGVHLCGPLHPRYGKEVSQEQRRKASEKMKGKHMGAENANSKKVKCIETQQIFGCLKEAGEWCNLSHPSDITASIKNKKSAGKHPDTKVKLHWEYVE